MENKVFKFFEEWEILFKEHQIVVPKDSEFRELFRKWLEKQVSLENPLPASEKLADSLLPKLIIWKKYFRLDEHIEYEN